MVLESYGTCPGLLQPAMLCPVPSVTRQTVWQFSACLYKVQNSQQLRSTEGANRIFIMMKTR